MAISGVSRLDYYHSLVDHWFPEQHASISKCGDIASYDALRFGHELIQGCVVTGFNVYRTNPSEYQIENQGLVILYANYARRLDHFSQLLATKEEIPNIAAVPVHVGRRASEYKGRWPDDELEPIDITYKCGPAEGATVEGSRCLETILQFFPDTPTEAIAVLAFLNDYARQGAPHEATGSWEVPDVRSTDPAGELFERYGDALDVLGYRKVVLNVTTIGGREDVCMLRMTTRFDSIESAPPRGTTFEPKGWRTRELWVSPGLVQFISNEAVAP